MSLQEVEHGGAIGRNSDNLHTKAKKSVLKPNVITPKSQKVCLKVKETVQILARKEEMFFDVTQAIIHKKSIQK